MTPQPDDLGSPASYLTLEAGTPVVSSDGKKLGRVERVVADEEVDVFDGLVIDTGPLGAARRFVQGGQVEEIYERAVVLKIDAAAAEDLPPR